MQQGQDGARECAGEATEKMIEAIIGRRLLPFQSNMVRVVFNPSTMNHEYRWPASALGEDGRLHVRMPEGPTP